MDALALLCTLHADGPATTKRLRLAGHATLERVLALCADDLATLLGSPPAVARRFQREARSLLERIGLEQAEPHAGPIDGRFGLPPVDQRLASRVVAEWKERGDVLAADDDPERAHAPEANLAAVLAANAVAMPASNPASSPATGSATGSASETAPDPAACSATNAAPISSASAVCANLAPAEFGPVIPELAVDGLDAGSARALARAGVSDLELLATCDALLVARASGLAYPRVVRWRALAARLERPMRPAPACSTTMPPAAEPTPSALVPEAAPAAGLEGAGGPFA